MKSFACFQVVLFTTLELYNEDDVINHHGFERSVTDTSKAELATGRKNNVPHKIAKTFGKSFIVIRNEPSLCYDVCREVHYTHWFHHLRRHLLECRYILLSWLLLKKNSYNEFYNYLWLNLQCTIYSVLMVKVEYNYFSI